MSEPSRSAPTDDPPTSFVTVTERRQRCGWCGRVLPEAAATGRPRTYCRRSCRQRAFEERRRVEDLTWGEDRVRASIERRDDQLVALASVDDLLDEWRRDVEDGRSWDDGTRDEQIRRLVVLVDDLGAATR